MDLIAKAGGVTEERGNLAYVLRGVKDPVQMQADTGMSDEKLSQTIADARTKPITVNLQRLLDEGDMTENIRLQTGDTIYIPPGTKLDQATTKIYVQGRVKRPGVLIISPVLRPWQRVSWPEGLMNLPRPTGPRSSGISTTSATSLPST